MATQPTSPTGTITQRVEKLTAKAVKSNNCCGQIVTLQVSNFQQANRRFDDAARPIDPNSPEAQAKVAAAMLKMEQDSAKISEQYSIKNKLLGYANTAVEAFKETFTNAAGTARGIGGSIVNFGPDVVNLFGEVGRYGAGGMYLIAGGLADAAGRAAGYGTGGGDQAFANAQEYFNNPQLVPWRIDPLYKPQEGIEQFWYTMSPINWWPAAGGRTVGGRVAINTADGILNVTPSTLNQINGILATSKTPAQAVKNIDAAIEAARKTGASPGDLAALEQTRVGLATGKIKPTGKPSASADGVAVTKPKPKHPPGTVVSLMEKKYGKQWVEDGLAQKRADPKLNRLLTDDEYLAIRGYTGNSYKEINDALRGGNPGEWGALADEASGGMRKLAENGYKFDGPLVRDAFFTPDEITKLFPEGGVFTDRGFMSTTTLPNGVFPGNTQFHITSNQSGVLVRDIAVLPNEAEVLFIPGSRFDVVSVVRNPATGQTTIRLREKP
jgi:ADP-ribosyltransferase exoenzyme